MNTGAKRLLGALRPFDLDALDNRDDHAVASWLRKWGPRLSRYFRADVRGIDRLPDGAALFVGNHNGGPINSDTVLFAHALCQSRGVSAVPYALGHGVSWDLPLYNLLAGRIGVVRASHENALRLFARGSNVLVYPGGELEVMRPFSQRNRIVFGGRVGYIRLALRARIPLVPVVAAGAHSTLLILNDGRWIASAIRAPRLFRTRVWPISISIPWGLNIGPSPPPYLPWPARIRIEVLQPIRFERDGEQAAHDVAYVRQCAASVEAAMQSALLRLAAES
jgi:1-acyl-sn-glycerol-3-phosphate acyltransferase